MAETTLTELEDATGQRVTGDENKQKRLFTTTSSITTTTNITRNENSSSNTEDNSNTNSNDNDN